MSDQRIKSESPEESDQEQNHTGPSIPPDEAVDNALRNAVTNTFRTGKLEELTVRRMRSAAEGALGLQEGFLRGNAVWKKRSDRVVKGEVEVVCFVFICLVVLF